MVSEILKNPNLFIKIQKELDKTIVGEGKVKRALFLGMNMINVQNQKSKKKIIIGGESSSGKDFVMKAIGEIFPTNRNIYQTRISNKLLNYWHANEPGWTWDNKNLCLTDVNDELLNSDVFKVFLTDGSDATIVINGKAVNLKVNGRPNVFVTTAEGNPNNQMLTRFDLITLDESADQTEKIMEYQAREAETGEAEVYDKKIISALSQLKRVKVIVPYAMKMIKYFPKSTKMRRVYPSFIDYIRSSCALHQYQRKKDSKNNFIAEEQDYMIAREIIENIREQTLTGKTSSETKYLSIFESLINKGPEKHLSYTEIHKKSGYKTPETWWRIMKSLEEKGIVVGDELDEPGAFKPVRKYKLKQANKEDLLKLPIYKEL